MWPLENELEDVTFGFNISNRQGERLRDILLSGQRVVLSGKASGIGLESFYMDAVVARIPGSEPTGEELVICGHLDHPKESANDNGSGSGAMLDIARALKELIDSGRMAQPKRSIRFLWIAEFYGIMAYVDAHPELTGPALGGSFLAGMNLDMVGENLELLHSQMNLTRVPSSLPTVVNDVVANMAQMVDGMDIRTPRGSLSAFNYRITPYSGGSDHVVLIDRKIPGIMLGHSDYTHHTSEDTPDKVDPVELERSEILTAATMLFLSDMTADQAVDLAYLAAANSAERLGAAARRARGLLNPSSAMDNGVAEGAVWFEVENTMFHAGEWERESVGSVLQFNDENRVREAVRAIQRQLERQEEILLLALKAEAEAVEISTRARAADTEDSRVPDRLTRGPLGSGLPATQLPAADAEWYSSRENPLLGNMPFELVNFIDGVRTVTDIRNALSAEFGPVSTEAVARYVNDLVRVGVAEWK
jgi:Zn-dependent M28 family amino/carboxypeptidase